MGLSHVSAHVSAGLRRTASFLIVAIVAAVTLALSVPTIAQAADESSNSVSASTGIHYDISGAARCTNYVITESGDYYFSGQSDNVWIYVKPSTDSFINIHLEGDLRITPTSKGRAGMPLASGALTIDEADGAIVNIITTEGANAYLSGYLNAAAISKNGTATKLVFQTRNPDNPGTITAVGGSSDKKSPGIGADGKRGTVAGNIVFESGNVIAKGYNAPGIGCKDGGLTISGISIEGGTVTATGTGGNSAGIGSENGSYAKNITISGGTVTATGSGGGAGIGGGGGASNITISGGTVTATGGQGSNAGAGIGAGGSGNASDITISGGTVTATGGTDAAGIGGSSGENAKVSNILVQGGTITATGSESGGAGIGGGYLCESCLGIRITGGTIKAKGGADSSGIGSGMFCVTTSSITIDGGRIEAKAGNDVFVSDVGSYRATNVRVGGGTVDGTVAALDTSPIVITGGSVRSFHEDSTLVDDEGNPVLRTVATIEGLTSSTLIQDLNIGIGQSSSTSRLDYGQNDLYTLGDNGAQKLFLYLPASTYTRTATDATGQMYQGNIYPGQSGELKRIGNIRLDSGQGASYDGLAYAFPGNTSIDIQEDPSDELGREVVSYKDKNGNVVADADGTITNYGRTLYTDNGKWTWTNSEDAVLYAVWENEQYTIIFNANKPEQASTEIKGFSTNMSVNTNEIGVKHLNTNTWTLPGYEFVRWNTESDGMGDDHQDSALLSVDLLAEADGNNVVTLYAQWKPRTYTVTFNAGGGSGTMDSQQLTFDKEAVLYSNTFEGASTGTIYTPSFVCWKDEDGTTYADGAIVKNLCTHDAYYFGITGRTLTAQWSGTNAVVITISNNGQAVSLEKPGENIRLIDSSDPTNTITGFSATNTAGVYQRESVPEGTYYVDVDEDAATGFPSSKKTIKVENYRSNSFNLNYCTITIAAAEGEHVNAWIGDDPMPASRTWTVFQGDEVTLQAVVDSPLEYPYVFAGYDVEGITPDGFDAESAEEQTVTVTGGVTITARARPISYSIAFNSNYPENASTLDKASGTMDAIGGIVSTETRTLPACALHLPGYAFAGWSTNPDGSGKGFDDKATVDNLATEDGETIMLYAQWRPISYTVAFDANTSDATGSMERQSFAFDTGQSLSANTFVRTGYTFMGWNTSPSGDGTDFANGAEALNLSATDGAVVTLYAQWERDTYTATFDKNAEDAVGTMSDETAPTNDAWTVPGCGFTRTGYLFDGWTTQSDGSGAKYEAGSSVPAGTYDKGAEVTLYAQWKPISYTIAFDANVPESASTADMLDGQDQMVNLDCTYNAGATLTQNKFVLPGYEFTGWNTSPDGSGGHFDNGARADRIAAQDGATIILFAQWEPLTYEITFQGTNEATGTMEPQTLSFDEPEALHANEFSIVEGASFVGWATTSVTGAGPHLFDDEQTVVNLCTIEDDGTLVGFVLTPILTRENGAMVSLALNTEPLSGKTVTLVDEDGNRAGTLTEMAGEMHGTYYLGDITPGTYNIAVDGYDTNGAQLVARDNDLAYAFINFYTITVESENEHVSVALNESSSAPSASAVVASGGQVTIEASVQEGCVFEGYTVSGATPQSFNPSILGSQTVVVTGATEITAHARPIEYTVSFNANGGDGSMAPQTFAYGDQKTLSPNSFTRPGYTFAGWNTTPDGSGKRYGNEEAVLNLATNDGATVELYAQWEPANYEISFSVEGGGSFTCTATFDQPFTLPSADESYIPGGKVLLGWSGLALGSFYPVGSTLLNYCTIQDDGTLVGGTLNAVLGNTGAFYLTLTNDGNPVDLDSDEKKIHLVRTDGVDTEVLFQETSTRGVYSASGILEGSYYVEIKGWSTGGAITEVSSDGSGALSLSYCTVEIAAEDHASAWIESPSDGHVKRAERVLIGSALTIGSSVDEGYSFESWTGIGAQPDWGDDPALAQQTIIVNGRVLLEAHPVANVYRVSFDANGGDGSMESQDMVYGQPQSLAACAFTRTGYSFTGWATTPDGSGERYDDEEVVSNLATEAGATVTLYAQWESVQPSPIETHTTTVSVHAHGTASVDAPYARHGETVTVTIAPDDGFEVRSITAVDAQGTTIELSLQADGTYTFSMPAADVSVAVVLGCDGGELCPSRRFPDADPSQWYHDALDWAIVHGVLNGFDDTGLMEPDSPITRAQMARVLWNAEGLPQANGEPIVFSDVSDTDWFAPAVAWASSEGIFEGYAGTDLFGPNDVLTREQAAAVLMRWEQLRGFDVSARADLSSFPDANGASDWAVEYLSWAVAADIIRGVDQPDGSSLLDAQGECLRAHVATLLMRLLAVDPLDPFA